MENISKKELLIISCLRDNARSKLTRLSKLTKIPVSTIFDRMKAESNIIKKYTTLIDFQKLGFSTIAKIALKVKKEDREKLKNYLLKHKSINSLYRINNGFDFLIEGIFRDLKELEEFLESVEEKVKLKTKQVYYIIDDLKRESFLSQPEYLNLTTLQ